MKSNEFKTEFLYNSIEGYTKHKHNMSIAAELVVMPKITKPKQGEI